MEGGFTKGGKQGDLGEGERNKYHPHSLPRRSEIKGEGKKNN